MGCGESKSISADTHRSKHMSEDFGRKGGEKGYLKGEGEEEKKESTPQRPDSGGSEVQTNNTCDLLESKQADLPEFLQGRKYTDESAFLDDLEKNGVSDLRVVLNEDGYAVWKEMPSDAHNNAVGMITDGLDLWRRSLPHNVAVKGRTEPNVRITRSYSPKRRGSGERQPDFAIFGPERLDKYGEPKVQGGDLNLDMNPHVIIQFGWKNEDDYEEHAIDDMMNYAGVGKYNGLGRPNVAYLIKAIWKGKHGESPVIGFNIYELRQDQRRQDVHPTLYRVGGDGEGENVQISISATDMGVPVPAEEGEEGVVDPFTIDVHEIRQMLEDRQRCVFEAAEETE